MKKSVSSPPRAGVPAPSAVSNQPADSTTPGRVTMLAPAPNGGSGNRGLKVPLVFGENSAGENPRPLTSPPNSSNHTCAGDSSSAGITLPQRMSASGQSM